MAGTGAAPQQVKGRALARFGAELQVAASAATRRSAKA